MNYFKKESFIQKGKVNQIAIRSFVKQVILLSSYDKAGNAFYKIMEAAESKTDVSIEEVSALIEGLENKPTAERLGYINSNYEATKIREELSLCSECSLGNDIIFVSENDYHVLLPTSLWFKYNNLKTFKKTSGPNKTVKYNTVTRCIVE
jgi:hypothetical protein